MSVYNESSKAYTMKYISDTQKELRLRYKKDVYESDILPYIEKSGLPVASFIKKAIAEKIERDYGNISHE